MGLRERLRNLERAADVELVVVEHEDGTTSKYRGDDIFPDAFLHETARWRRNYLARSRERLIHS